MAISAVLVAKLVTPLTDLDSLWHVRLGTELLNGVPFDRAGQDWLARPVSAAHWRTSQWLSEMAMSLSVSWFGWQGLIVGKLVLYVAALVSTAVAIFPRGIAAIAAPIFCATALSVATATQERPASASYIFIPLLAALCINLLEGGPPPPVWLIAALTMLWANLHGSWVLAPAALALVTVLVRIRTPWVDALRPRAAIRCFVASLAGIANPLTWHSFLLPFTFQRATPQLLEWLPTQPWSLAAIGLMFTIALIALSWARNPAAVPWPEVGWVLVWVVFSLPASRNIVVASIMLAPVAVRAGQRALQMRPATTSARERRILWSITAVTLGAVIPASLVMASRLAALPSRFPVHIAMKIGESPRPVTVLNAYNSSAALIAFSSDKAKLLIDGRADLWGAHYIRKLDDVAYLRPGWQQTLRTLNPDVLVIDRGSALDVLLQLSATAWQRGVEDGHYVMWTRDRSSSLPIVAQGAKRA